MTGGGSVERGRLVLAGVAPPLPDSGLLERGAVLGAGGVCLERARAGRGAALFIIGEAGLGKTSVLERTLQNAVGDVDVRVARGEPREASLAFGVARELLGALADFDDGPVLDSAAPYYRVLRSLRERAGRSLLLAVDDLHWSDPDSLRLLAFLARRLDGLPVALIATLRPWPREAADVCAELAVGGDCRIERLAPLSRDGAAALLAERAGVPIPEPVQRGAWRLSAGNPLLVGELARAVAGGERVPDADSGRGARSGLASTFLLSRFAGVEPAALSLARAGSVLGTSFSAGLAAAVAGLLEESIDGALESLSASGLLVDHDGETRFAHPLFAEALYDDLAPPLRRRLHDRAFRELAGRGLEAEAAAHAVRADLAGDRQAQELLARVGRSALAAGAVASAAVVLEAAVRLAGERPPAEVALALAEALTGQGRAAEALAVLDAPLSSAALDWADRRAALRVRGRALLLTASPAESVRAHEQAIELAIAHRRPELAVEPLLDRCLTEWMLCGPGTATAAAGRALPLAASAERSVRERAQATWAKLAWQTGDPGGLDSALEIATRLERERPIGADQLVFPGNTLDQITELMIMAERFEDAERACRAVQAAAERTGAIGSLCASLVLTAQMMIRRGRPHDALAQVARGEQLAELYPGAMPYLELARAEALLWLGRLEDSEASCRAAEQALPGLWYDRLVLAHVRGLRLLWQADRGAVAEFLEAERQMAGAGIVEPCVMWWWAHAIEAHLALGASEDAVRVLDWLERCAARMPCRWPRAAAQLGRAALAAHQGDAAEAEDRYRAAVALCTGVELPLLKLEALLALGGHLRRRGRLKDARGPLSEACQVGQELGAAWLADRARRELRLAGGRRRRRAADRDQLTAAERPVAELAAAGRTNAEIAGQLRLSQSTIETHLRHVYSKLGILSRRELQAHAPNFEPPQPGQPPV